MKQILPLRTIEYNVPSPAESARSLSAGTRIQQEQAANLLHVQIDFQTGQLQLEGNWDFIMGANRQAEQHWLGFHCERVRLTAALFPGEAIDLAGLTTGAAFAVEGKLFDQDGEVDYSGLLLMDPAKENKSTGTKSWNVSLYLYNSESDDCEIKLKWPIYPAAMFADLN
ncbi:MAG: hypothetical protein EOP49_15130 [Sphingobacteriales bacterium]|nr:MAG: hypothetical protein EOP49_15130 [Sphingobacteriales bacterium]